jgi:CxxC motif-containing protein
VAIEMTCITCPIGCSLLVERTPGGALAVTGNRCPRGATYAREELLDPRRTVTATARVRRGPGESAGAVRRVPCKTSAPFPKERVPELLATISALEVELPVSLGKVLVRDLLGLGIDLVATRTLG